MAKEEKKRKRGPVIEPIGESTLPGEPVTQPPIDVDLTPVDSPTPAQAGAARDPVTMDKDLSDPSHPYGKPLLGTTNTVNTAELHDSPVNPDGTGGLTTKPDPMAANLAPGGQATEPAPAPAVTPPPVAFDKAPGAIPAVPAKPPGMQVTGISSTSKTEQKQMGVGEAMAQGALDTDTDQEKEIAGRTSDENNRLAAAELKRVQKSNERQNGIDAERERITSLQNDAISKFEKHVDERRAEYEKMATSSIGPKGFWSKQRPAAEFVSALSSAIGARNAIMYGGRNMIQDQIDKSIDNDFRNQQAEIENRKDLLKLAKEDVLGAQAKKQGLLYDLQVKKIGLLDAAQREREELLAQHGVNTGGIAKDSVILAIQKKRDEEKAALQSNFRKTVENITNVQKAPGAPAGARDPLSIYAPGTGQAFATAPTAKAAEAANDWLGSYSRMQGSMKEYRDLINKYGKTQVLPADVRGRLDTLHAQALAEMNSLANKPDAVLRPAEIPFYEKMIPKATGWAGTFTSRANMVASLDEVDKQLRRKNASVLNSVGVKTDRNLLDRLEMRAGEVQNSAEGK